MLHFKHFQLHFHIQQTIDLIHQRTRNPRQSERQTKPINPDRFPFSVLCLKYNLGVLHPILPSNQEREGQSFPFLHLLDFVAINGPHRINICAPNEWCPSKVNNGNPTKHTPRATLTFPPFPFWRRSEQKRRRREPNKRTYSKYDAVLFPTTWTRQPWRCR